ncbi:MAG: GxxExxY protein [Deltaproteobacteria bacterium]|nr:GxxExxY protein [Deltaproteobacteria bacterium]
MKELTGQIIAAAMKVHTQLGPGLLESAYEACLEYELKKQGLNVERQKALPVISKRPVGRLINFHVLHLREGIKRLVNHYKEPPRFSASFAVENHTPQGVRRNPEVMDGVSDKWIGGGK